MNLELFRLSAIDLAEQIRLRTVSPSEALEAVLDRIADVDPGLNALVTLDVEYARKAAATAEVLIIDGRPLGPLHGVPITVKDLVATEGMRTTYGSRALASNVPDADAPSVLMLRQAGAVIVGKTTTPEFGHKAVTDGQLGAPTVNPWNTSLTAGGSSGGAAAAVATGMGPIAVGTDGGGSIRVPAAFCGVFGIKATTGTIPSYPPSFIGPLGHTGPMARSVDDAALALAVMQGRSNRSVDALLESLRRVRERTIHGVRVGVFRSVNGDPVEPELLNAVDQAALALERLGAQVQEITLPCEGFEDVWDTLFDAGMLAQVEQLPAGTLDSLSDTFQEVVHSARRREHRDMQLAEVKRTRLNQRLTAMLRDFDVLLGPTVAVPAFELGIDGPLTIAGKSVDVRAWWRLTQLWNLGGQPACSLPYGFTRDGLPVGVQLVGPAGQDDRLLGFAALLELPFEFPDMAKVPHPTAMR